MQKGIVHLDGVILSSKRPGMPWSSCCGLIINFNGCRRHIEDQKIPFINSKLNKLVTLLSSDAWRLTKLSWYNFQHPITDEQDTTATVLRIVKRMCLLHRRFDGVDASVKPTHNETSTRLFHVPRRSEELTQQPYRYGLITPGPVLKKGDPFILHWPRIAQI